MKYTLLIYQGSTPTPDDPEAWATLSEAEQHAVYRDYQALREEQRRRGQGIGDGGQGATPAPNPQSPIPDTLLGIGVACWYIARAPPNIASRIPMATKLSPNVARMQSTSSWPWLLARRTSGRIMTR